MAPRIDFVVEQAQVGERLDRAVARRARVDGLELSNRQAKGIVEQGAIQIDGEVERHGSRALELGERVTAELPAVSVTAVSEVADLRDAVVYRDDYIIAISKPSGLPTHATHDPNRDHAHAAVARLLGDDAYVAVHHRLDVETSGVLVFAIDRRANKGLAAAFAERDARKRYLALTTATDLDGAFEVDNHLGRDRHDRRRMCAVNSGGDRAQTTFVVTARSAQGALVEARPRTGRTHQIRVHLAGIGAPILGDVLYGGVPASRVMLHAQRLELAHPVTGSPLHLEAPLPEDFVAAAARLNLEIG